MRKPLYHNNIDIYIFSSRKKIKTIKIIIKIIFIENIIYIYVSNNNDCINEDYSIIEFKKKVKIIMTTL